MNKHLAMLLCSLLFNGISISYTLSDEGELFIKEVASNSYQLSASCSNETFCSPWHYCDKGLCVLGDIPYDIVKSESGNTMIVDNRCITYNKEASIMEAGYCIFNFAHAEKLFSAYYKLDNDISALNEDMCGDQFNRTGTLCGRCEDDHYPLVYSYDMYCVKCPNGLHNWWKYAIIAFFPITIFYFIILFLKININTSPLFGFVYTIQMVAHPVLLRQAIILYQSKADLVLGIRTLAAFFGIWNLDFLRSVRFKICLGTNPLQTKGLDLASSIYPLLLMVLSYVLVVLHDHNCKPVVAIWKPFQILFNFFRRNWDIRTSMIDALATFYLLLNVQIMSISFDLLTPVKVYKLDLTGNVTHSWRLFYFADIHFFGLKHLPYAIAAIAVFLLFVFSPALLLLLYPFCWFQKLLNLFPGRWYILHTFVDAFQGCYKDGTEEGTRDCRWFASFLFLVRFFLYFLASFTLSIVFLVLSSMTLVVVIITSISVQPFKNRVKHYTTINVGFLSLLTMILICLTAVQISKIRSPSLMSTYILFTAALVLFYIPAFIIYLVGYRFWSCILVTTRRLQAWRRGYRLL